MLASIDAIKNVAIMIKVRLKNKMNYFIHRITNTSADGANSKISLIEKMT
jgi:hypothetical protein